MPQNDYLHQIATCLCVLCIVYGKTADYGLVSLSLTWALEFISVHMNLKPVPYFI